MTRDAIPPHGGTLVNRMADAEERAAWDDKAPTLPSLVLDARKRANLEMLAIGGFSPLEGFLDEREYRSVVRDMHLTNGLVWPIPITLPVTEEEAERIPDGSDVALRDEDGTLLAILHLCCRYRPDKEEEARLVYRTTDAKHPGVAALYAQGDIYFGGRITMLRHPKGLPFAEFRLEPAETRAEFRRRGWETIVAFQTRNPVHRAHEYLQKCALEMVDGLLLHPLVGETKDDDIPADVRMRCYQVLLENYYPADRVLLSVLPANMHYAGPREAVLHALVRQNYGCTHFIVGRDHAGVGDYYGTYDAQLIFKEFGPDEIKIQRLNYEHTFYCTVCQGMASSKTCPHGKDSHVFLSGTKVREMLRRGEMPPPEFTRPEVARILVEAMRG
ncbi:MAG: sulfate adenylyltransferase [Candidatus Dadabacteria bacterium]|nr:MAG: sulfate adenylyltransferase [Candidatus Dadabacteria bacterium]